VRVRFAGFGQSSLDIGVRIYALTQDFNEFYAIREDVLLRMSEIVKASGSSFAFPSQTLYMGHDDGLDGERGQTAAKEVESWRKAGKLPFPRLAADKIEQLKGTLDYPPRGSVADGSVDLYLQNENPGPDKKSNWLPAPTGKFILMLRLYWPKETPPSIIDGSWKIPEVQKVK
jgi:MscS family membrane protein